MSTVDEARLSRLADFARTHPSRYRTRVALLAVLGYAYLLGALLILGLITVVIFVTLYRFRLASAGIKLGIGLLWLMGLALRALWIRLQPPTGMPLTRENAPALMDEIERMRVATGAGPLHQVLLTEDLNASVMQLPRLGIFGWYRNYLQLGLPLLASMTTDEFRAVLAHEFGHISGRHSRFGTWLHRVSATWHRVDAELRERPHGAQFIFTKFFAWYAPYFASYCAVLSRQQEFEADRAAAAAAGKDAAAAALCRIAVADMYLGTTFWPRVFRDTRQQPTPPAGIYRRLWQESRAAVAEPRADQWLRGSLGAPTAPWDSHPSLAERLAALSATAPVPPPVEVSAADALLGSAADRWVEPMSRSWESAVDVAWRERHQQFLRNQERLSALEAKGFLVPLAGDEELERIRLVHEVRGMDDAVPLMQAFVDRGEQNAEVHYNLGEALLDRGDEAGLAHLQTAMELESGFIIEGCAIIASYLAGAGRPDEAVPYRAWAEQHARVLNVAHEERLTTNLRAGDRFLPHGLDADQLQALRTALAMVGGIKRAVLVRKEVSAMPEVPHWIIFVTRSGLRWRSDSEAAGALIERVLHACEPLGGTQIVATAEAQYKRMARKAAKVPGSEVYPALGKRR
ncbi:M48 family metallopeptidase [Longimicrobium terrae]|uniref:Zn-dependent protease with chaperone function n=1 Tax=Longimicrobium terrae TaxID=1639882 RepID=A0A841GX47_9BACT|nr:M48 family metallopeptidase [Longimicrobium terrae]MBB4635839.1 Zn-dependent protease with chaperone function [Longimicrobium terrae]MBB6070235.1 Zn-dependent protease with chaperone function [Longimicrobium terrae]NNC30739.1 M48 family metalloprotease [Longimicrobium terrae]